MRMVFGILVLLATGRAATAQQPVPQEIENPSVTAINKLPPRSSFWSYPDAASASDSGYGESPWVQSLNGSWSPIGLSLFGFPGWMMRDRFT